jgi:hypothetical protein
VNPKQLQSVIGHASIQLTYDTYGHPMPDSFEGFGSGLDAALRGHGRRSGYHGLSAGKRKPRR